MSGWIWSELCVLTPGRSSHIRVLVFSPSAPVSVVAHVADGATLPCTPAARPHDAPRAASLFVCAWSPADLPAGLLTVSVDVVCEDGTSRHVTQPFSVDGTAAPNTLLASFILLSNIQLMARAVFLVVYLATTIGLVFASTHTPPQPPRTFLCGLPATLWALVVTVSRCKSILRLLVFYQLYIIVGPWFVGELVGGQLGAFTVHGVVSGGKLFPTPFGVVQGTFQMVLGVWPLVLALGWRLQPALVSRAVPRVAVGLYCGVAALWQVASCWEVWGTYGRVAFFVSPAKLGFVVLAALLLAGPSTLRGAAPVRKDKDPRKQDKPDGPPRTAPRSS